MRRIYCPDNTIEIISSALSCASVYYSVQSAFVVLVLIVSVTKKVWVPKKWAKHFSLSTFPSFPFFVAPPNYLLNHLNNRMPLLSMYRLLSFLKPV